MKNSVARKGKWTVKNVTYSVHHGSTYGPTFGGGNDIYIANNCNSNTSSYASAGHSYNCPRDNNLLAGQYNFTVKEIEVWQLK